MLSKRSLKLSKLSSLKFHCSDLVIFTLLFSWLLVCSVSHNLLLIPSSAFLFIVFFSSDWFFKKFFLVLHWHFQCAPLLFPEFSEHFVTIALNSLSGKSFISVSFFSPWGFYLVFLFGTYSSIFLFCFTFSVYLYEIRQNSYLSQSWRCLLVRESPYAVCVCPVALVGELDLQWEGVHYIPVCSGSHCLDGRYGWSRMG